MVFKILIFPENNETNNTKKKQKYFFFIFWARQGLTLVLRILIKNEKSGLRSPLKILSFKKVGLFYIFDI